MIQGWRMPSLKVLSQIMFLSLAPDRLMYFAIFWFKVVLRSRSVKEIALQCLSQPKRN